MKPRKHKIKTLFSALALTLCGILLLGMGSLSAKEAGATSSSAAPDPIPESSSVVSLLADESDAPSSSALSAPPPAIASSLPSSENPIASSFAQTSEASASSTSTQNENSSLQPAGNAPIIPAAGQDIRNYAPPTVQIINNLELAFVDADNELLPLDQLHIGDFFSLEFGIDISLALQGLIEVGDYYDITMPAGFIIPTGTAPYIIKGPNEDTVATVTILLNGNLRMVFTDKYVEEPLGNGGFTATGQISQAVGSSAGTINVSCPSETTLLPIPIVVRPNIEDTIDKKGNFDRMPNPNKVTWTVNANKQVDTLNDFKLTEYLPSGLTLADTAPAPNTNIEVKKYKMGFDGEPIANSHDLLLEPANYTIGYDALGNPVISFVGEIDYPVEVTYTTTIDPATKPTAAQRITYTNEVGAVSTEIPQEIAASSSVTGRWSDYLEKEMEHYDPSIQQFDWLVRYNYREESIPKNTRPITDTFTAGMELVGFGSSPPTAGNFILTKLKYNSSGILVPEAILQETIDYDITRGANGFDVRFIEDVDFPVDIRYQTQVTDAIDKGKVYENIAKDGSYQAEATGRVKQQNLVKTHRVDHAANTITWTIYINLNNYEMNDFSFIDTISPGQTFIETNMSVHNITTGTPLTANTHYNHSISEDRLTFALISPYTATTDSFSLTYTTKYDGTQADRFRNTVAGKWKDNTNTQHTSTVTDSYTPTIEEKENGAKHGSYNATTKEISWIIRLNYDDLELLNAHVQDTLADNQTYVPSSMKMYRYTQQDITGIPTRGTEFTPAEYASLPTWQEPTAANSKILKVRLPDTAIGAKAYYWIEYKTSLEGETIDTKAFTNTAFWKNDATDDFELNASVSVAHGGEYVGKQGAVATDSKMHWTIMVNQSQSTLSNVVVTDTPSANQMVDTDSLKIYNTEVAENGDVSKDTIATPLILDTDYTLNYQADDAGVYTLVISFINTIARPYIIDYSVTVLAPTGTATVAVSNNAVLTATGDEAIEQSGSDSVSVAMGSGSGWLAGTVGQVTLRKTDSITKQRLPNVTFQLFHDNAGTLGAPYGPPRTTNQNGDVIFRNLLYGTYWLQETGPLPGYNLPNPSPTKINIHSATSTALYTIENTPSYLILAKQDSKTSAPLAGVQYSIYKKAGSYTLYKSGLSTGADGRLALHALPEGEYYVVETRHLPGYWASPNPIYFKVEHDLLSGAISADFLNGDGGTSTGTSHIHKNHPTRINISKWNEKGSAGIALPGASFILEQELNGEWKQPQFGKLYTSNAAGQLSASYLHAGNYRFIEVTAPVGYARHTEPMEFTILQNGTVDLQKDFENWPIIVILHKVDQNTQKSLAGAIFQLHTYDVGTNEWVRIREKETFYTGEDGLLTIGKMDLNTKYRLKEVAAPAGYSLNDRIVDFELTKGTIANIEVFDVGDWENAPSQVALVKTDEETGAPLKDAVYSLENYDSTAKKWNPYKSGLTTNVNGAISVDGIPTGQYRFLETEAPAGYLRNATPHEFTLKADAKGRIIPARVDVTNRKNEIVLYKTNEKARPLAGAVFTLERFNENTGTWEVRQTSKPSVSGKNGRISLTHLPPGKYRFTETTAPNGYATLKKPVTFTIKRYATENPAEITVRNFLQAKPENFQKNSVDPKAPLFAASEPPPISGSTPTPPTNGGAAQTEDRANLTLWVVLGILALCALLGLGVYARARRKNRANRK